MLPVIAPGYCVSVLAFCLPAYSVAHPPTSRHLALRLFILLAYVHSILALLLCYGLRYETVPWIQYALSTPSISCVVVIALCQNIRIIAQTFSICATLFLHRHIIFLLPWSHSAIEYIVLISTPTLLLQLSLHLLP